MADVTRDAPARPAAPMMDGASAQFVLPFEHTGHLHAGTFVTARSNAAARAWLAHDDWPEHRLWLWGAEGSGKTHLLRIWGQTRGAAVLAGGDLSDAIAQDVLRRPDLCAVALDDADRAPDGRALLYLVNAVRERAIPLLLAGRLPPARVPFAPPDLASRLRATASVAIGPADDRLLEALLLRLLAERDIGASRQVLDWLHRNLPRSPAARVRAAEKLDRAGLAAGRQITQALARQALGGLVDAP